jgi:hypothetical protein
MTNKETRYREEKDLLLDTGILWEEAKEALWSTFQGTNMFKQKNWQRWWEVCIITKQSWLQVRARGKRGPKVWSG